MNAKDIIEIIKESRLWEGLTEREKQDAIKHALNITFGTWKCTVKSLDKVDREIQPMLNVLEVSNE